MEENMFDINKLEVMDIVFADEAHERFFYEKVRELPNSRRDSEEIAMIYTLGICDKTRAAFSNIVDQRTFQVNPLVLFAGWQTSASVKVTRLAINLYTGFSQEVKRDDSIEGYHIGEDSSDYAVEEIFDCPYAKYFLEAVKLRYDI
ncbi:hypothetical protein DWX43_06890 [Clostridium sp. AF19-22AC]|uniref:Uncharacterized protein n=8 Tax=Lachnospiraceae TaxID=186803 RepID=A0ABX3A876_9FIRM|nr:hypothetical protein ANACAC_02408 [Anaerostipes caccae L1-92]EEQ61253.1 hypothetical protein CBFG_04965 [Clostridiales bacterium 1_7_47FAA]NSJ47199.1 hypothetical protein [Enterocloster aldenensis]NSJ53963.1 hypothetical protein [Enterocloster clostridioformis]ODR40017.1 hypothetical protein BEI62_09935 [Eisenbergiella tayi]RGD68958.1 hypothetical protein DWX31_19500 [Hungatella hathewayi]RHR31425.1 hypothetical protein DWX43_06890 [Clostridium sp. AF19-22AC]RJW51717.1 hypothetical protei